MTKAFGYLTQAKVLVIGHDPRLTRSKTIAEYAFFADYYSNPIPEKVSEKRKYELAKAVYEYIYELTGNKYSKDEIYITNLCNTALSPVKGRTVYINEESAKLGLEEIRQFLSDSNIEIIFAMSQQVNFWLQKLGFYSSNNAFLSDSEPKIEGVNSNPSYFVAKKQGAFKSICARVYLADGKYKIVPILHIKNWPLKSEACIIAYEDSYRGLKLLLNK